MHAALVRRAARRTNAACIADRKSTRLNSSHTVISYAVFCLKKKKQRRAGRAGVGAARSEMRLARMEIAPRRIPLSVPYRIAGRSFDAAEILFVIIRDETGEG